MLQQSKPETKRHAREVLVAPRLPAFPKEYGSSPFTTLGDVIAECDTDGCGYHVMGPRADVKKAIDEHRKMFHSEAIGVVLLNQPRQ